MSKLKLMVAALGVCAASAITPALSAVSLYVDIAPPAPRYEVVPEPRVGFVWAPGYWEWRNERHAWVRGHWVREERGMHWHPHHWVEHEGRWTLEGGRWDREPYAALRIERRDRD